MPIPIIGSSRSPKAIFNRQLDLLGATHYWPAIGKPLKRDCRPTMNEPDFGV
jgi:hypothetical protein